MTVAYTVRRVAAALILACAACGAHAEDQYPSRSITMVVPFAAGGPTDILGRIIAQAISPALGQQVVVEDVTGAGGTIGATKVARAAPDGYTMVMGNLGTHAASLGIYKSLPYDPRKDFEPVILVASTPMVLVTKKTLPVHTLSEVIAYAKANKGKTTMGSAGVGSISHLTLLLFNHLTGADVTHVPYRGLSRGDQRSAWRTDRYAVRPGRDGNAAYRQRRRECHRRHDPDPRRRPYRTCRLRPKPACPICRPLRGRRCSCPRARLRPSSSASMGWSKRPWQDPAIATRLAQIGADVPPPDQRSPEALGHLVNAEVDKWVPLIKSAGVVAQ